MATVLHIPATSEALDVIKHYVTSAAKHADLDHRASYQLRLAVDEIATNVLHHGSQKAEHIVMFNLEIEVNEQQLKIILEDTGLPYNPYQAEEQKDLLHEPPEKRRFGGLGVYLALHSVDELKYERFGEWNRHIFVVKRDPHDTE